MSPAPNASFQTKTGHEEIMEFLEALKIDTLSQEAAEALDESDPLKHMRSEFNIPLVPRSSHETLEAGDTAIYFCGNSLGLQPKHTAKLMKQEMDTWSQMGVMAHFDHPHDRPWVSIEKLVVGGCAKLCGANPDEIAVMGSLTSNLHLMLVSFYCPSPIRYKVLIEKGAFPSDQYVVASQVEFHGYNQEDAIIELEPRIGEDLLRTEDILETLRVHGSQIALVMLPGVQYYTGQAFDMEKITLVAQSYGCIVGWDLAHATGNLELELTKWNVDFAVFCSYKYLNSGPGGIAGLYVNNRHCSRPRRFAGWWGKDLKTRFDMKKDFQPIPGAAGYQLSNPSVFATTCMLASLQVFEKTDMKELRAKSKLLTAYLYNLLKELIPETHIKLITPEDEESRGCQISIKLLKNKESGQGCASDVLYKLEKQGIVVDKRNPDVIRVSPVPLYNTFLDCHRFVIVLKDILS